MARLCEGYAPGDGLRRGPVPREPVQRRHGLLYASYQAYCNDPDLDLDLVQTKLGSGARTPQNDFEKKLLQDIIEARKEGKYLEIYPN